MNRYFASAGAVALAALLGWTSYQVFGRVSTDAFAACRAGMAGGTIGGPFELVDETGQTVTDKTLFTKPALVYFGYASCPDVCPLDNARNVEAADMLKTMGFDVTPIFISIDAARDTPPVLAEYTSNFGDNLLGLTGTLEQVKAVADAYRVAYVLPKADDPNGEVQHTTLTYLVLPGIGFADFYHRETTAQQITEHTSCFLKSS